MSELMPKLTEFDRRVLAILPEDGTPVRFTAILAAMLKASRPTGTPEGRKRKTAEMERDVRGVLRGAEHLGLVDYRGGGWWRRAGR